MLISLGELAEGVGIESIWVSEHLVLADPRVPPSPMDPEEPILDPVTALAFLAARTAIREARDGGRRPSACATP